MMPVLGLIETADCTAVRAELNAALVCAVSEPASWVAPLLNPVLGRPITVVCTFDRALAKLALAALALLFKSAACLASMAEADDAIDEIESM